MPLLDILRFKMLGVSLKAYLYIFKYKELYLSFEIHKSYINMS